MSESIDYDDSLYAVYDHGQALSDPERIHIVDAFTEHVPPGRPLTVLDLGSGTGRFTVDLAREFGGPVFGVEPSRRMRAVAERRRADARVRYLAGDASRVPLSDATCDVVVMLSVFHHVPDPAAALTEVARVLRPDGRVLIAGTFAGRPYPRAWGPYFPRAHDIEEATLPTVPDTEKAAAGAGLLLETIDSVEQLLAPSMAAYLERMRYGAVSTFRYLTPQELADGMDRLATEADRETRPHPVVSTFELLVLRKERAPQGAP